MALTQTDIELIAKHVRRNFSEEELEELGWLDRPFDQELRLALAAIDLEFFARYYLPHHFDLEPAKFHQKIFEDVQNLLLGEGVQNLLEVVFRGGGKTTIVTLALPLWSICFLLRRFIVVISDTQGQSKEQLATVKDELEHNERIEEDFGNLVGSRWTEDDIETKNRVKIIALGANQKIRGRKYRQWRPDLIILDLMMPGVDGFEVISHLKKSEETRDIPIIIVSAKKLTSEEIEYLNNNIEKIIRKGDFSREELLKDIKKTLEKIEG